MILNFIVCFFQLFGADQDDPVTRTFRSTNIINQKSVDQLYEHTFEFRVGHRFGDVYSGLTDLFGLDLGASIYLGFDFGLTDNISVGFSRLNLGKTYEIHAQVKLLSQQKASGSPVSISLYAEADRLTQLDGGQSFTLLSLPIAKKFTPDFSVQIAPFYIQRVESKKLLEGHQRYFGTTLSAQYVLTKTMSLVVEYSPVFNRDEANKNSLNPLGNNVFSFGTNIEIFGHTFQLMASNTQQISTIASQLGTNSNFSEKHFFLGFNLTRLYSF